MNYNKEKWIKYIFVLIFCTNISCINAGCVTEGSYIIRHIKTGLVLEAGLSGGITVQYFDGYAPQLWLFENGIAPGLFYIVNQSYRNGKVLSSPEDIGVYNVTISNPTDSLFQQWFIDGDNSITNAGSHYNLDVHDAPGDPLRVFEPNGSDAQKFLFQEKLTMSLNGKSK